MGSRKEKPYDIIIKQNPPFLISIINETMNATCFLSKSICHRTQCETDCLFSITSDFSHQRMKNYKDLLSKIAGDKYVVFIFFHSL